MTSERTLGAGTRAVVVFNPAAGQAESMAQELVACRDILRTGGWSIELTPTVAAGDGTRIARDAADLGYEVVIAAGGDGTINEVINGLAGTSTALGAIPIGTMNVWIRELGLPLQPRAAAEALLKSRIHPIDLGRAGDRYFLLMAGIGFDAAVVNEVRSDEKRRLGAFAYAFRALGLAFRFRGARVRMLLDGKVLRRRSLLIVLGNSQLYAGIMKLTVNAVIDDGLLDLCLIRGNSFIRAPIQLMAILLGRHTDDPEIEYHRVQQLKIESRTRLPVQVDGDHLGYTPITIECVPGALQALLPTHLPTRELLKGPA
ncbi:MAG: diacylglycerol kinase family lipid kinase [Roseiflexaceae bacterium]